MEIGDAGLRLIDSFETCRLESYNDGFGYWTIGRGHRLEPGVTHRVITQAEADELQHFDLHDAEAGVEEVVEVPLTQNQFDALVSIVYNVGHGRRDPNGRDGICVLRVGVPSTLVRRLNVGDYAAAADQFLVWNRAGGQIVPGLTRRRVAERALFLTPEQAS